MKGLHPDSSRATRSCAVGRPRSVFEERQKGLTMVDRQEVQHYQQRTVLHMNRPGGGCDTQNRQ